MDKRFGHYSFAVGVIVAIILGVAGSMQFADSTKISLLSLLIVLGIVVGGMNITGKETQEFLLSSGLVVILILLAIDARMFEQVVIVGNVFVDLLRAILAFTLPAVLVVGVKNIWRLAKSN